MPRPKRQCAGGVVYHVLNRANGRLRIFKKRADFEAFERVLAEGIERVGMRLCGYCIMGNHWHLLLWPRQDGGYFFTQGDDKVYMVSRDYRGKLGPSGGGLIWVSRDGLYFPADNVRRSFKPLPYYLQKPGGDTMERPQILQIDGKPTYMYTCSRLNVNGDSNTCSYVFKFRSKE